MSNYISGDGIGAIKLNVFSCLQTLLIHFYGFDTDIATQIASKTADYMAVQLSKLEKN